jgi:hypothetical protein
MEKAIIEVRPAVLSDIDGIMEVEKESFGEEVSKEAMASPDMMRHRITLLNQYPEKWFWVGIYEGRVVSYIVMQRTALRPEDCVSWSGCTDNGILTNTFDPRGHNIYGVSGGALENIPGAFDILLHKLLIIWLRSGAGYFMLCSRMPGYRAANEKKAISPEDYWKKKDRSGKPFDWMLKFYSESLGLEPVRLLTNGFSVDKDSGGHGVLCIGTDPVRSLDYLADKIYRGGFALGKQTSKKAKE